jgi:chemotaxis protein CheD
MPAPALTPPPHAPTASAETLAYVPPGRLLASSGAVPLTTIVSTGAAVCVWDPVSGIGGMAHFLLPEAGHAPPALRFGDVALRTLVEELVKLGAPERRLRARIYGGSAPPVSSERGHLGERNIEAAQGFLKARFVPVLECDAGGGNARKIVFSPKGGTAEVTRIGAA